jgi:hypothetical protein
MALLFITVKSMSAKDEKTVIKYADPSNPATIRILAAFPEEVAATMRLTEQQVRSITLATDGGVIGLSTIIPRQCKVDCEFSEICMFRQQKLDPVGSLCPDEILFIETIGPKLIVSMNIDTENFVEWDMLKEYIDASVRERRAQRLLSMEGELSKRVSAVDQKSGDAYWEDKQHEAKAILESAVRTKTRIRKELLLTREQREKYKKGEEGDEATKMAELRKRLDDAKAEREKNIEEATFSDVPKEPEHTPEAIVR